MVSAASQIHYNIISLIYKYKLNEYYKMQYAPSIRVYDLTH